MSIKIIKPGMLTTLQGTARDGYRSMGIGSGGAMDSFAMMVANYLTGNEEEQAVMEMNFPAPEIIFLQDALISLTGANFSPIINGTAVPRWTPLFVKMNSVLQFKQPVSGTKAYLAVKHGWHAEKWLNSYSTHLKVAAGGHSGRALQKNDIIEFAQAGILLEQNKIFPWHISGVELEKVYQPSNNIRCIKGIEWDLLEAASKTAFEKNNFVISDQSDRMGYRLNGQPLLLKQPIELISSATDTGIIQLLPGGNCIVLMADHQTTGGYPRIASVIKADIPKLVQAAAGTAVHFTLVSLQEAEDAFLEMKKTLRQIKTASHLNFKNIR